MLTDTCRPNQRWHYQFQDINVTAVSHQRREEPDPQLGEGNRIRYDTVTLQEQLGATHAPLTLTERRLLQLDGKKVLDFVAENRGRWSPKEDNRSLYGWFTANPPPHDILCLFTHL